MIKVYYLRQLKDEATNTEYTEGSGYISHAVVETTEKPDIRRVIIEQNPNLEAFAQSIEKPSEKDIRLYNSLPAPTISRDIAAELDGLKAALAAKGVM